MIQARDFSLRFTFESGQPLAFYGEYGAEGKEETLSYVTEKGKILLRSSGTPKSSDIDYSYIGDYSRRSARIDIERRLGLGHDLKRVYDDINTDKFIGDAIRAHYGLRITKSEPWEAALCYTISQFNNMKRIRGIIRKLIGRYGKVYKDKSDSFRLFPDPSSIANARISDLNACGTGFRSKYIKHVAKAFCDDAYAGSLYKMGYDDAKAELTKIHGIGEKVADCILLFGYGKLEAFPIDVWVKRTIEYHYIGHETKLRDLRAFVNRKWPRHQAYIQQYIFWHGRSTHSGKLPKGGLQS